MKGVSLAGETVSSTFGPRGGTFAWNKGNDTKTSKDGITLLKTLEDSDEAVDMGIKLVREASDKANMHSGDGSTSTAILTYSLCSAANKLLKEGININELRKGFKAAEQDTLKALEDYRISITEEQDIYKIAYISANSDEEIATYVKDAFTQIGDNGLVAYADSASTTGKTFLELKQGIQLEHGYMSGKCINSENNQCILHDAKIVLFKDLIDDVETLAALLQPNKKDPLLLIAPEYSQEVIAYYTKQFAESQVVFIKADGVSVESVNTNLEDLAVMTGTIIIGREKQITEYNIMKDPGKAKTIVINKNSTIISDPEYDEAAFEKYVDDLKAKASSGDCINGLSPYQIEALNTRIAKMTGGIATIYIGALTKQELGEKKDRYDDAINAVRNALSDGIVIGGGRTLLGISYAHSKIPEDRKMSLQQQSAYKEYMKALRILTKLLISSTGSDQEVIIPEVLKDKNLGFNASTGLVSNLVDDGVYDPYLSVYNSVLYASNMAYQFMSIETVIVSNVKNLSVEPLDEIVDPGRAFN